MPNPKILLAAAALVISAARTTTLPGCAQTPKQPYPSHLPYSFSNFVWWSDADLRALLKQRIPGLGDQVAATTEAEGRIRNALTSLLRNRGIAAEVQSIEPSTSGLNPQGPDQLDIWNMRLPPTPSPSVEFSVLSPRILIGDVSLQPSVELPIPDVESEAKGHEGQPYTSSDEEFIQYRAQMVLRQHG